MKKRNNDSGIDITPIIDVVFFVLIFFVVISIFTNINRELEITLPKSTTAQTSAVKDACYISLDKSSKLYLNEDNITEKELSSYLIKNRENISVILQIDESIQYKEVINLIDLVRTSGVSKFSFSVIESK